MNGEIAVRRSIYLLPLYAAFLAGPCTAVAQPAPSAPQAQVTALPDGVELTVGSSMLDVQVLENQVVDVHVRLDGQSTPRTLVIAPSPDLRNPSAITRSEENGVYVLSTPAVTVRIQEANPYSIAFLDATGRQLLQSEDPLGEARNSSVTMRHAADDTLYGIHGLGLDDTTGGITRNDGGKVAAGVQGDSGGPFIFSIHYGLLIDSDGGEFRTEPGSFTFHQSSRPDLEYFVFAGPPLETMAALSRVVGPPPLAPKWTLGFLNSQWGSTQAEVEKIVATYRKKQVPFDGFILDFDWKAWGEDNYGEWRWNSTSGTGNVAPDKYPGGASGEFAKAMAAEGVKLTGILKPRIITTVAGNPDQPTEAAAYATAHHFWYPNEAPYEDYFSHRKALDLDFNNPDERAWFWQHLLPAFHAGMAAWWNDEADFSGAHEETTFNNFQFLNMGRALYEGQRKDSNQRVWSINRDFYLGASRYAYAEWSGDIKTGFATMAFQRTRMLAALDTGESHWSMDGGGFGGHPSDENYARWLEFAAFVPIMRVHGTLGEHRQPWTYGHVAEAAARHALELRYEMIPYMYSYERLNSEGEVGLVRPLFWQFPSDAAAAAQDSEWMFGDALLAAPIVTEGAATQKIYLPPGEWFDYSSGRRYDGAQSIEIAADSKTWKDIPLFVRNGSIVATQPLEQYVGQRSISEITLDIFPSEPAARFTVYDDDGVTYDYEKGQYLRQEVTAQKNGNQIQVTVDAATGEYASPLRTYLLKIHAAARHITLNGKPLRTAGGSLGSLSADTNWVSQKDRFGPVVLLKISAGAKAPSVISLE